MPMRRALWFGRAASGLVAAAVVLSAAAFASPGATERDAREGGTFLYATSFVDAIDPALDPFLLEGAACGTLMGYPNKPLPEGLHLRPELAEADPVVSRDGRTYTFTIRKDARFSTGAPVTARAFARALERIRDPALESPSITQFEDVREVVAKGKTLTLRLTKRQPLLPARTTELCAVPPNLSVDAEGAKAPLPSAAPYYVAEYWPGERLVLERNRFYKGSRVHHVDRFVASLGADPASVIDGVARGDFDYASLRASDYSAKADELVRRYGINRSQFWVAPGAGLRMFVLNTSRRLFRKNPKLRQAVNFAANRAALTRELGAYFGGETDQYLLPAARGFQDERIYPLEVPDLKKARELAQGHLRSGKAVLYAPSLPARVAGAQILQQNLEAIGLDVELKLHPPSIHFGKIATAGEPFDIADTGVSFETPDPSLLNDLFAGRTIGQPDNRNFSYFNSPKVNRLLDEASRLTGAARYRAYGELDVQLSRDFAPAIPFATLNAIAFVSARVGCVVMNLRLDLTAVCLK